MLETKNDCVGVQTTIWSLKVYMFSA